MRFVDIAGLGVDELGNAVLVLQEREQPHRILPISIGAPEAIAIAMALNGQIPPRPLSHDLMAALVSNTDAHVERIEVTEVRDGAFVAELAVDGPAGKRRLDSRPSDAIALAVRVDAPMFVDEAVLDSAGIVPGIDEEAVESEVHRFRTFLDNVEPDDFANGPGTREQPDADDAGDDRSA